MSFLLFLGVLLGIVVFALIVNRLTGTRSQYLDALHLPDDEPVRWRDERADVAFVPRQGGSVFTSYSRLRRHSLIWTDRRLVVAQKALFTKRRMITHQIGFAFGSAGADAAASAAADQAFGGFFGRGYETIIARSVSFGEIGGRACARLQPTEAMAHLNLAEVLIFSDRLDELRTWLPTP